MGSWLQQHYDQYCQAGGDHSEYVVYNDIGEDVADKLKRSYDAESSSVVVRISSSMSTVERIRQRRDALDALELQLV